MGNMMIRPGFLGFDVFGQFFNDNYESVHRATTQGYPVTDIYRRASDGFTIMEFALAGFKKSDLHIDVRPDKNTITVCGAILDSAEDSSQRRIARRNFSKTYINYDSNLDLAKTEAKFENGLLTITVPTLKEKDPLTVEIQ